MTPEERIRAALMLAVGYSGIGEVHHKDWVIDQMVRVLAGDSYGQLVRLAKAGTDGPDTFHWDVGVAP